MASLVAHKVALANHAVRKHRIRSFADIGGCWGVAAGYAVDLLAKNDIEKAYVVDEHVDEASREAGRPWAQLEFVEGRFNEPGFIARFPRVDALVMYDILLHQVDLDWDAFLEAWSGKARVLIIYNQMWKEPGPSVRFLDRGLDWYLRHVYYNNTERITDWFSRLDEIHEPSGRKWRDLHNYWQFGIVTPDLLGKMDRLGFRLDLFENFGRFHPRKSPMVENEGFIFVREADQAGLPREAGGRAP